MYGPGPFLGAFHFRIEHTAIVYPATFNKYSLTVPLAGGSHALDGAPEEKSPTFPHRLRTRLDPSGSCVTPACPTGTCWYTFTCTSRSLHKTLMPLLARQRLLNSPPQPRMSVLSLRLHGDGDVLVCLLACLLAHPSVVLTTCGRRMAALDCHPRPAHCSTQWTVGQLLLELVPFDMWHMGVDDLLRHSLR